MESLAQMVEVEVEERRGLPDNPRTASARSSLMLGSVSTSLRSQEIIEVMHPETGTSRIILGICRGEPLTDLGKRLQLLKILSLTLLPILGLWAFTVYSLSDSIEGKSDIEQTQYAVQFSVEIGKFLDRIQRERDMSVLYLSILGPETKTFLMNEYLLTDQAVDQLSDWPENYEFSGIFRSKSTFKRFLKDHRNQLDPSNYNIYVEMDFYNFLIGRFVEWMYGAIRESNQASIWKILVAYQKIVTGMEHVGIERSLGTVFYVEGGFPNQRIYEGYNNRVNNFKANYRSAVLYSHIVDPIFQEGVTATGTNLTAVIEKFRYQMQRSMRTEASVQHGQWWFDNMTLYLDTLLIIQQDLANLINGELQKIIDSEEENLTISACFLVIVFLMCPLVIYTVEALTSDIQKYALAMVHKTKELSKEKKKTDSLLYQMVPRQVAKSLKEREDVDAEYFKSVTILFSEIMDFMRLTTMLSPMNIVALLNEIHTAIDEQLDNHDVYKVETINDCYMVASGLPTRIGNRHSAEVANLALDLLAMIQRNELHDAGLEVRPLRLRIGINTGACMAGIVGTIMPRYCLFGDTVNTASRMKTYSLSNRIHISTSTYQSLKKHAIYIMQERGRIAVKGKGEMMTYWLTGRADRDNFTPGAFDANEVDHIVDQGEIPGEVRPHKYDLCISDNLWHWVYADGCQFPAAPGASKAHFSFPSAGHAPSQRYTALQTFTSNPRPTRVSLHNPVDFQQRTAPRSDDSQQRAKRGLEDTQQTVKHVSKGTLERVGKAPLESQQTVEPVSKGTQEKTEKNPDESQQMTRTDLKVTQRQTEKDRKEIQPRTDKDLTHKGINTEPKTTDPHQRIVQVPTQVQHTMDRGPKDAWQTPSPGHKVADSPTALTKPNPIQTTRPTIHINGNSDKRANTKDWSSPLKAGQEAQGSEAEKPSSVTLTQCKTLVTAHREATTLTRVHVTQAEAEAANVQMREEGHWEPPSNSV